MKENEISQMLGIARKYYELGMNQDQIAREEYISKSTVCRLIKKAVQSGYVRIQIDYPLQSVRELENQFAERFCLDKVFITPAYTNDEDILLKDTCKSAVADLLKIVRKDDVLCVTWGNTMEQMANVAIREVGVGKKCEKVVLMNGSMAGNINSTRSSRIVEQMAGFFSAEGFLIPAPMIVDSKEAADVLKQDSHIRYVLDYVSESQIAVISIGSMSPESVLCKRGAYAKEEFGRLLELGAVGDIAGRCFDIDGRGVDREIEGRLMGPALEEIKAKRTRMGIASGVRRARAIIGALRGGIVNRLYTDELAAQEVLRILKD